MINAPISKKSLRLNTSEKKWIIRLTFFISFILASLFVSNALAKSVTIQWDTNDDAEYYVVYWGNSSGDYSQHSGDIDAPETQYTAVDISEADTWYFAVKAYNSCGNSSDFSDEVISSASSDFLCSISSPGSNPTILEGKTLNFQGSATGGIGSLSYFWDFGDSGAGSSSVEDPGNVIFSNAGRYTINFTVTDDDGDVVTDSMIINVMSDITPSASITSPGFDLSVMAGASVDFQGSASGGNGSLSYLWNFGGSGAASSSIENPGNVTFSNAGTYTITFTVTDDDGDVASDTVRVNVASDTIPSASITSPSSEQSIMAGATVDFQGIASGGDGSLSYFWDFGGSGAASSSIKDPGNVTFTNAGTYTITFTVTDDDGDVASDTVKVNVASDTVPSASISSPASEQSIMAGTTVNFQGIASGGNGSLSYFWNFGGSGAASSSIEDPGNVIFSNAGTYTITFTVTDDDGDVASDTVRVNVASDTIPSASISSPSSEQSIMAGTTVNFQGIASGGNGSLSYFWNFGGSGAASSSIEDPGNVIFSNAGTYTITFTVTDDDGDVVSDTVKVSVASDTIPAASISSPSSEQSIMVGAAVNFQGIASGGNGSLSYLWDFDGGAAASFVEDPGSVIFSNTGTYEVDFTVTDSDGDVTSDTIIINVASDAVPSASIVNPDFEKSIMAGTAVNFQGNASGGNGSLLYVWDFDGGAVTSFVKDPGSVVFSNAGTYDVAFTVTDSDGDVASDTVVINVASDNIPSASIVSPDSEQSIMAGAFVNFQGSASGGKAPLTYLWDFEDGAAQTSVEDPGNITFSTAGTYLVTFSVTDSDGDIASDTVVINVENDTVQSVSIEKPAFEQTIMAGEMIDFQGNVSGGNFPFSYVWDFDGGPVQRSVEDPGTIMFASAGTYDVAFIVTDSNGDVVSDSVTITVSEPIIPEIDNNIVSQPDPVYPNEDTDVSLTPELQADISEQNSQTRWQISKFPDFSSIMIDIVKKSELSFLKVPRLVLDGGTKYYWRVRQDNTKGDTSSWSNTVPFSTTEEITADKDSNGIPDAQEIDETIDLDFDGVADIGQDDIKCVRNIMKKSQVLGVKKGHKVSEIELVEFIDPIDILDTSGMPDEMPSGLIGFKIQVDNPGDTAEVTICFSEPAPEGAGWYKYDSINGWENYTSYVSFSSDRMSVSVTLTDGGNGDADGTENGVIVDPGGLGVMNPQAPMIFSESSEEGSCFIRSTGALNGLAGGNSFCVFFFRICVCFSVMILIRKFY